MKKDTMLSNAFDVFKKNFKENYDRHKITTEEKIECQRKMKNSIEKFKNS